MRPNIFMNLLSHTSLKHLWHRAGGFSSLWIDRHLSAHGSLQHILTAIQRSKPLWGQVATSWFIRINLCFRSFDYFVWYEISVGWSAEDYYFRKSCALVCSRLLLFTICIIFLIEYLQDFLAKNSNLKTSFLPQWVTLVTQITVGCELIMNNMWNYRM